MYDPNLKFNTKKSGLDAVFRPYQEILMSKFWKYPGLKMNSNGSWKSVNEELPKGESISRASVINFLNKMVDEGVLGYIERTGKGGHQRVYNAILTEQGFWEKLATETMNLIINSSGDPEIFAAAGAKVEVDTGAPICANCGVSVTYGRLELMDRVSLIEEYPTVNDRKKVGFEHPRGEYLCKECNEELPHTQGDH